MGFLRLQGGGFLLRQGGGRFILQAAAALGLSCFPVFRRRRRT